MIKNRDVVKYFSENAEQKTFTELSKDKQNGKALVSNEQNGYDYEKCALNFFETHPFKVVDAVYIKGNKLFLIEFKGGFVQKINYNNFELSKWECTLSGTSIICKEGAKIFLENQELKMSQLIESIKGKLLETHALLYGIILPQCSECQNEYEVHYVAVINDQIDPVAAIENGLNELGDLSTNEENPISRLKKSLKKYNVKNANNEPLFFDYIDVWNTFQFNEIVK